MKKNLLFICLCSAVLMSGCLSEPKNRGDNDGNTDNPIMDFDWKTTRNVSLDFASADGNPVVFYVYNGDQLLFSGFAPFKGDIAVSKSVQTLTVANHPKISVDAPKVSGAMANTRAMEWVDGEVEVDCGNGLILAIPKLIDHHEYLYSQWLAWSSVGQPWSVYVAWWNTPGFLGQSSIRIYENREPTIVNGKLYIYHTCLWPQCEENNISDATTQFNTFGTYIFEDLFPSMGDYDMNDFVVVEEALYTISSQNKVKSAEFIYKVNAVGAKEVIAMAVNFLSLNPSMIDKVELFRVNESGDDISYQCINASGVFSLDADGLELSSGEVVIPLFDNVALLIDNNGHCFNTVNTPQGGKGDPLVFKVKLSLKDGVDISSDQFKTDVFIMPRAEKDPVSEQRSKEIHVTYAPFTSKMNTKLFGTGVDDSNISAGKNFRTKEGYVWAIYIPKNNFKHPLEYTRINEAYPKFDSWINSGGEEYADWYDYPVNGKVWEK